MPVSLNGWKAGVAAVDITPAGSMWLAGWAKRRDPAAGTASPLRAKALALQDARGDLFVMVSVDLIAVPRDIAEPVAAEVKRRRNLERDRILFNAAHTHTAPEVRLDKAPFFRIPPEYVSRIPAYVEFLKARMVNVIEQALSSLAPAQLSFAYAHSPIAKNRRSAGGPVDHSVPVLIAADEEGDPRAVTFGYACHDLTLPPEFVQYCAEFSGYAERALEKHWPGSTTLFLSGAGADNDPHPQGTLKITEQHGNALADAVMGCIKTAIPVQGMLSVDYSEVDLEFEPLPSRDQLLAAAESDDLPLRTKAAFLLDGLNAGTVFPKTYPCPIHVVRFGDASLLIALGGEPVVQFALDFRKEYGAWTLGYSNDMFGYVPTRTVQREGGYEGGRAMLWSALPGPFTDDTERRIREGVARAVARVKGPA